MKHLRSNKTLLPLTLWALLFTLPACSGESEEDGATCASDNECKGDRICQQGACVDPSGGGGGTGGGSDMGGGGGGGTTTLDCSTECPNKLTQCGFPQEYLSLCVDLCASVPQSEVQCLVDASCQDLQSADADSFDSFCTLSGGGTGGGGSDMGGGGTGGTDMGGGGSGQCESTTPKCEGDKLVSCEVVSGVPINTKQTCARGCERGACVGPVSKTTIRANHEPVDEPICVLSDDQTELTCLTTVKGDISSDPDMLAGSLRIMSQSTPHNLESPSAGGCNYNLNLLLNRSEISFNLSATDTLPSTACVDFISSAGRNGMHIQLENVEELNSSNTLSTVDLIID